MIKRLISGIKPTGDLTLSEIISVQLKILSNCKMNMNHIIL